MKTSSLLSLLVLGAAMSAGAAAYATDCSSDADCAADEVCSFADTATPCIPEDPNCGTTTTTGICTSVSISGECTTDADCPTGLSCEEIGGSACASPACPPGEPCPEPTPCEPTVYYGCVAPPPPPCTADSDCGDGLTCIIESYEVCSAGGAMGAPDALPGGASDGSGTGADPVADCTTETYSYCAPRWMGPCTTAADCGDGFTCEPEVSCACSGSSGTDVPPSTGTGSSGGGSAGSSSGSSSGSAGGAPTPVPTPDGSGASTPVPDGSGTTEDPCACEPTGSNYCALPSEPTACTTAADCPTDWSCEELPVGDAPCAVNPDGTTDCPEPTTAFYCLPPHWREAIAASDAGAAYTGSRNDALGGGAESASSPLDNLPGGALDAAASGSGTPEATSTKKTSDSGCSAVGSSAGIVSMLLSLVGLVALRRRRIHG